METWRSRLRGNFTTAIAYGMVTVFPRQIFPTFEGATVRDTVTQSLERALA